MFFSITATQRPWYFGICVAAGLAFYALGARELASGFAGSALTLVAVAERRPGRRKDDAPGGGQG